MKASDEMFRDLGYKKIIDSPLVTEYAEDMGATHIIIGKQSQFVTATMYGKNYGMTFYEILTCAQLIKEMEEE